MKIRKAMTMLGVLTLAFGLSSCGETTQSSTTTTTTEATLKHNVTVSGSGVTVVGLDSNGYAEGSVVTLGLFLNVRFGRKDFLLFQSLWWWVLRVRDKQWFR